MAKNIGDVAAKQTAARLDQLDVPHAADSDQAVHDASSPIIQPQQNEAAPSPFKTDADIHSGAGRRTPRTITVVPGDVIVHYASLGRWFKGEESMRLNPDLNIMGVCKKSFVYQESVGALYHNVSYEPLRRFLKPKQCEFTGANMPGGDIRVGMESAPYTSQHLPQGTFDPRAIPIAAG